MTIHEIKRGQITETPLLLFDCQLSTGLTERWSTHEVSLSGRHYHGRVLKHNVFDIPLPPRTVSMRWQRYR